MRKLLLFLVLLVVCVVGVGFYLGWIGFSAASDSESGRTVVQFSFGRGK